MLWRVLSRRVTPFGFFFLLSWGGGAPRLAPCLAGLGRGEQRGPQHRGLSFLCGWPLRAEPASSHPSQVPPLLSGPALAQENQFCSRASIYPASRIHVLARPRSHACPVRVPSHARIPSALICVCFPQRSNSPPRDSGPDQTQRRRSCVFWGAQGARLSGDLRRQLRGPPFVMTPRHCSPRQLPALVPLPTPHSLCRWIRRLRRVSHPCGPGLPQGGLEKPPWKPLIPESRPFLPAPHPD